MLPKSQTSFQFGPQFEPKFDSESVSKSVSKSYSKLGSNYESQTQTRIKSNIESDLVWGINHIFDFFSSAKSKGKTDLVSSKAKTNVEVDIQKQWQDYYPKVYAYFYKRVENRFEVEELTSLTMNTTFLAQHKLNKVIHFNGYLWKVAHNYLVGYIKTKNLQPLSLSLDLSDFEKLDSNLFIDENSSFETGNSWVDGQRIENTRSKNYLAKLDQLKDCVSQNLSIEEQKLVDLTIYQEQTSRQVGISLGIKPEAVRKRLQRTIAKLKAHCTQLWKDLEAK